MSEDLVLVCFLVFVVLLLIVDLGVFQRRPHFPTLRNALAWTILWILLAMLFDVFIWFEYGGTRALEFLTGYVVEEALSVDNVFVFIIILSYFAVPKELHHRVLFVGVLSAIILRAVFIVAGSALVSKFHPILYLLGAFLIFTAVKLVMQKETEVHPERNPVIRFMRKYFPLTTAYEGQRFTVRRDGKLFLTPLFLVLVMIESSDIAFATDSIPAIFAITRDTFIIFTSNICAILGLRALYFVVSGFMQQFRYLKTGLSFVLGFIGLKMLIEPWLKIPILYSLLAIMAMLTISILASLSPLKQQPPPGK